MEVIVLAGGLGTRIKSVLPDVPKPMAPIHGRPFLEYLLDYLAASGITDAHLAVGYLGYLIKQHFGSTYKDIRLNYSNELSPLGTGGAVVKAAKAIDDEFFMVMNGDSYVDFDLEGLLANFYSHKRNMICVSWTADVSRFGKVTFDERVKSFSEKSQSGGGYINAGIYILNRNIFSGRDDCAFSLEDHLAKSISQYVFSPYVIIDADFIDIGTVGDLARAESFFSHH